MSMKLTRHALAAVCLSAAVAFGLVGQAFSQEVSSPTEKRLRVAPISAYVSLPKFLQARLSPDGKYLAALVPVGVKYNIAVLDLNTMKPKVVTNFTSNDVLEFSWVGERLVFSLGNLTDPTGPTRGAGGGLFSVKFDGSGAKQLHPTIQEQIGADPASSQIRQISVVGRLPGVDDAVIVEGPLRNQLSPDLYKLNLATGRMEILTFEHPGFVRGWLVDQKGVPRLALTETQYKEGALEQEREFKWLYRDSASAPWREIYVSPRGERERDWPVAFAENNRDLIVSSRRGRDTTALYSFDVEKRQVGAMLAGHPRYDVMSQNLLSDSQNRMVGLRMFDETVQTVFFDEKLAVLQAAMEKAFPGKAVFVQGTPGDRALVTVASDRSPAVSYLFDQKKRELKELLRSSDDLDESSLVAQTPFLFKTRDGLDIPGYYFLPANHKPGMKHPTVVHIHGGPMARADRWGWGGGFGVMEAQVLASRGYAVILPNFRVTPEMGAKIYQAGLNGALGTTMSDDHEDAAKWGIAQGFVDPERICISGASYGGYAALWAMVRSNHLFKCGVAGLVVSDLESQITSPAGDIADNPVSQRFWKEELLGIKPGEGWQKAHAVSPARHVDKFMGDLFIYAGRDDIRTPLEQTLRMVKALDAAGKKPATVMIKDREGHGYAEEKNLIDLYEQMLQFLAKSIGQGPTVH